MSDESFESIHVHKCGLPFEEVKATHLIINSGPFINLRRKVLDSIVVNKHHPKCSTVFRSNAARRREMVKHLAMYSLVIHPFSMFALFWEFMVFLDYILMFCIVSLLLVHQLRTPACAIVFLILEWFLVLDMLKIFNTGYYDYERNRTVLRPWEIFKHYLKTYFFVDFIASVSSIVYTMSYILKGYQQTEDSGVAYAALFLRIIRILRLPRIFETIELWGLYYSISSFINRTIHIVLAYIIFVTWALGFLLHIENIIDKIYTNSYDPSWGNTFYNGFLIILVISHGKDLYVNWIKYPISLMFMTIGFCFQIYIHAQMLRTWKKFTNAKNQNYNLLQQFIQYVQYKTLPVPLRKKIFAIFSFKYQNQYYNEAEINNITSNLLRQEILIYITQHHIEKVAFFKDLPLVLLGQLVIRLKSEIYLANDTIIVAGIEGDCMYFIYYGTVAVYTNTGKEICHLEDGAHFGEVGLISNEPRTATVIAVSPCEIFILSRKDFLEVTEPYPIIRKKILNQALERIRSSVTV